MSAHVTFAAAYHEPTARVRGAVRDRSAIENVRFAGMLNAIKNWLRRRKYKEGKIVSRFIARDVRRDVLVLSTARIDEGVVTAQVRTTNLLYLSSGLAPQTEFGPAGDFLVDELWHWTGKSWGGLPDGNSLVSLPDERRIK